jgi:hypothetical protein
MTDTFRALCAELMDAIDSGIPTERIKQSPLAVRVDAALAQPEPQGPTVMQILALSDEIEAEELGTIDLVRRALARWGRPAIEPVPVNERLPGPEDCDLFERVWAFNPVLDHWKVTRINQSIHTHWLPYWALPVPGVEGADA